MQSGEGETATRHKLPDRAFHWLMAASVLALCATAFLPILGWRFDWVALHWIAGVVLVATILFHLGRVTVVHGVGEMVPGPEDVRQALVDLAGRGTALKPAKYDAYQKAFHWAAVVVLLALAVTGLMMLVKLDTPFWRRDPSILSDPQWGVVYVIHGLAALAVLFLIIIHVYFAVLPEHRAMLLSMVAGRGPLLSRGRSDDERD